MEHPILPLWRYIAGNGAIFLEFFFWNFLFIEIFFDNSTQNFMLIPNMQSFQWLFVYFKSYGWVKLENVVFDQYFWLNRTNFYSLCIFRHISLMLKKYWKIVKKTNFPSFNHPYLLKYTNNHWNDCIFGISIKFRVRLSTKISKKN